MWVDSLLEFSDAQALTVTAVSTNVIDLSVARQVGVGKPLWIVFSVDVAAGGTTPTVDATLQTDDNEAFASAVVIGTLAQLVGADMVAGARFAIAVPFAKVERYLRINFTMGGTTPTVTLSAFLTDQEPTFWQSYPDAVN